MSDCCSANIDSATFPARHACPLNGQTYARVAPTTIRQHVRQPWLWAETEQGYYFCSDPDCPVVYFGQDGSTIDETALRQPVGVKDRSPEATICYCFGVTREAAQNDPQLREFVIRETRLKHCACESRNPSGRCCLADFPKLE